MGYLVWPMSVLAVAMRGLRDPLFYSPNRTTGASGSVVQRPHWRPRRERARPPPRPLCPSQRMQASAPCRAPCRAGYRATWAPTRRMPFCTTSAWDLDLHTHARTHTHTHAHTRTHTHTHTHTHAHAHAHAHTQSSTVTAWLEARDAASCGFFLPVVTVMPRLSPMCTGWAAGPLRRAAKVRGRSLLQQQGALRASAIARACCMPPCSRPINKPAWDPRSVYHAAASTYAIRRNDSTFMANANRPTPRAHRCTHAARTHARTSC
jgi:hypothetical protein